MNDLNSVLGRLSGPSDSPLSFSPSKSFFSHSVNIIVFLSVSFIMASVVSIIV